MSFLMSLHHGTHLEFSQLMWAQGQTLKTRKVQQGNFDLEFQEECLISLQLSGLEVMQSRSNMPSNEEYIGDRVVDL